MKIIVYLTVLLSASCAFGADEVSQNADSDVYVEVWKDNGIQFMQLASLKTANSSSDEDAGKWVFCSSDMLQSLPHPGWPKTRKGDWYNPKYRVKTSKLGAYCIKK